MRIYLGILRTALVTALSLLLAASASAASKASKSTESSTSSHKSSSHKSSKSGKASSSKSRKKGAKNTAHGQHSIDAARTTQIQEALIREHYLDGEPNGKWDQSTKDALVRYQEANGWQTKSVPDSRALIKLGLGPDKKGLLNPDTAVMTSPHELGAVHDGLPGGSSQQ